MRRVGWSLGLVCLLGCEQDPWHGFREDPYAPRPGGPYPDFSFSPEPYPDSIDPRLDLELGRPAPQDLVARAAFETLESFCGRCHANGQDSGGFDSALDIPRMIQQGLIVPGSSAESRLMDRLLDGSMPPAVPPALAPSRPSAGDIALIARFIDELAPSGSQVCRVYETLSPDQLLETALADLAAAPAADRRYLRYVSLTAPASVAECERLELQRRALFKLVNSVSRQPEIVRPVAVDASELLYRIDLRSYGWERALDIDGDGAPDTSDAWQASSASAGPYALELVGPEADAIEREAQTPVPILPLAALVRAVSAGDLYYALIGVPPVLEDMKTALGIDSDVLTEQDQVMRAAISVFRRTGDQDFLVTAEPTRSPNRSYWNLANVTSSGGNSIYQDPLDYWSYPRLSILRLPNGLQAYAIEDVNGFRTTKISSCQGDGFCTEAQSDAPALHLSLASCHACHAAGLLPATDVMRGFVELQSALFDRETYEHVLAQYVPTDTFDQQVRLESSYHLAALERAGVPPSAPDPISRIYFGFEYDPLGAEQVAAELGVPTETLLAALPELDPALSPLGTPGGYIDRAQLSYRLFDTQCVLFANARNRPNGCP